jgi:hypothetical protein
MSKYVDLLRDDQLLIVNRRLAVAVGLDASITLRQVVYWMDKNRANEKQSHFIDNRWWCYNKYEAWRENNFPFWSISAIRRNFATLEGLGLVLATSSYNKIAIDKTKWYTVDLEAYERFMALWEEMGAPSCGNGGKPSSAYQQFLEAWKRQCTTVHCEQSSVHSEHMDCSPCTDHVSTVNKAIPEISTQLTTEKKEKESLSIDKANFSDTQPEMTSVEKPLEIKDYQLPQFMKLALLTALAHKSKAVEQAEAHIAALESEPISDMTTETINPVPEKTPKQIQDEYQEIIRRVFGEWKDEKSPPEILQAGFLTTNLMKFFRGMHKSGKESLEYQLETPWGIAKIAALYAYYRRTYTGQKRVPRTFKVLREKCDEFDALPIERQQRYLDEGQRLVERVLGGSELDAKLASNGTRFDNFSAPKPEDYAIPEGVEYL